MVICFMNGKRFSDLCKGVAMDRTGKSLNSYTTVWILHSVLPCGSYNYYIVSDDILMQNDYF